MGSPLREIPRHVGCFSWRYFPQPLLPLSICPILAILAILATTIHTQPTSQPLCSTTPHTRELPVIMSSQRVSSVLETSCKSTESLWPTPPPHLREQSLELSISSRMVFWTW